MKKLIFSICALFLMVGATHAQSDENYAADGFISGLQEIPPVDAEPDLSQAWKCYKLGDNGAVWCIDPRHNNWSGKEIGGPPGDAGWWGVPIPDLTSWDSGNPYVISGVMLAIPYDDPVGIAGGTTGIGPCNPNKAQIAGMKQTGPWNGPPSDGDSCLAQNYGSGKCGRQVGANYCFCADLVGVYTSGSGLYECVSRQWAWDVYNSGAVVTYGGHGGATLVHQ